MSYFIEQFNINERTAYLSGVDISLDVNKDTYQPASCKSVNEKLTELEQKLIKLVGMAVSAEEAGATEIGDVYYNTYSKTLQNRISIGQQNNFVTIPFHNGAIYQYGDDLYVWDGENLNTITHHNEVEKLVNDVDSLEILSDNMRFSIGKYLGSVATFKNLGYIALDGLQEGDVVSLTPQSATDSYYDILPIKEGYNVSLYLESRYTKAYAIVDENNVVIRITSQQNYYSSFIAPPKSDKIIVNSKGYSEEYAKVAPILQGIDVQEIPLVSKTSYTIPAVGEVCPTTPSGSSAFSSQKIEAKEGDVFILNGTGGESARLWCFLDENNIVLAKAEKSKVEDFVIAPTNTAFAIVNSNSGKPNYVITGYVAETVYGVYKGISQKREIELSGNAQHIICNNGVGNVCDVTPVTSQSGLTYAIVNLQEDVKYVVVNGVGGSAPRLWCFLDENNVIISVAEANAEAENLLLRKPEGAKKLIINDKSGQVSYIYFPSIRELQNIHDEEIVLLENAVNGDNGNLSLFEERVTPNLNSFRDVEGRRKTMCLAGLDTMITNNTMPYTKGLLWHEYPSSDGTLYYSTSINGELENVGKLVGWNPIGRLFAISPKDKRIISTKTEARSGICVFDGTNTTILQSINGISPCGWLYNSGVDFISDGEDEYCIFAEYGGLEEFHVWRGKYPYTSESDWEIVLTKTSQDITHYHQIRRDPWTDILYCTSGDYVGKLYWWYSLDKGATWIQLTDGTEWEYHCARCINFIFTADYIYWATDFGENHSFNRIRRGTDGIIDISTREKLANLPYGQATNSICYHEGCNGIFFYERLDSTFQHIVRGYYTLFYSITENKLYKLKYYTLNEEDYRAFFGATNNAWGGHRGKCYLNYANPQISTPMMGFTVYTPCIINMIGQDNMAIGTIYYE